MRPAIAVALIAAALAAAPASAAPELSYGCSPPLPATAAHCYLWHTGPVTLAWDWDQTLAAPVGGKCGVQRITQDTAGLAVSCKVEDLADHSTTQQTAVIRIDATPPSITGMIPARPPDHGGWWNHPVALSFRGADATSGIAGCDTVTYAGPDSATAQAKGGCRDAAGNVATRSFAIAYDATPPSVAQLTAKPGDRSATLRWRVSPDAVLTEVVRSPGLRGAPSSTLFRGLVETITDSAVRNRVTYGYTVSVYDAAGNVASAAVRARPSSIYSFAPPRNARLRQPPMLRWPRKRTARYYNVQLFRGRDKVLSVWPRANRVRLHRRWTFEGRRQRLKRGRYRWYVWPGYGSRASDRYGRLIGRLSFRMVR